VSIQIYNGYRLAVRRSRSNEHSFEAIGAVLTEFKRQARPVVQTLVNKRTAYLCARIIDNRVLEFTQPIDGIEVPPDWSPMMGALRILLNRYREAQDSSIRDPDYDLEARITVIPSGGEVLALLWAAQPQLMDVWAKTEGVEWFPYWNNQDRPAGVSQEEWAVREGLWSDACGEDVWTVAGYTTEVIGRYGLPVAGIDGVFAYLPVVEERAELYALDRVVGRRCRTHGGVHVIDMVQEAIQWVRGTREGNAAFQNERDEIATVLPPITAAMLAQEEELQH
jgi:hypothetical protein